MTEPNDRFDALLDAMLTKPELDVPSEPEADLDEGDED